VSVPYLGAGRRADFTRAAEAARTVIALEEVKGAAGLVLSADQRIALGKRLKQATEQLPELAKTCYCTLYEPFGAKDEYRIHDLRAQAKTQPNVLTAVVETLREQDRLLSGLDPALLIRFEPYKLWPNDVYKMDLKGLREYFGRYLHLSMLEGTNILKSAVARRVQNEFFELVLTSSKVGTISRCGGGRTRPRRTTSFSRRTTC
jgi:hypothetical protein